MTTGTTKSRGKRTAEKMSLDYIQGGTKK